MERGRVYEVKVAELGKDSDALHWWVEKCREEFRRDFGEITEENFVNEFAGKRKPKGEVWFRIETSEKKV